MKRSPRLFSRFTVGFMALTLFGGLFAGVAQAGNFICTVKDVAVFTNRVHVQCTTTTLDGSSNIRFFAVPTSDATLASRVMTVGTTALVAGRRFIANFDNGDTSGTSFGCAADNCRKLTSFGIE